MYYVKKWSLALDLKIFFMTIWILLGAKRADDTHRAPKVKEDEIVAKNMQRNKESNYEGKR